MKNLEATEFRDKIQTDENAVVIDVRSPHEEVEGLIENSINMNIIDPGFAEKVKELDKSKNYYVYCRSGGRSSSACGFMDSQQLNTYNLEGGIIAWNQI